MPLGTLGPIQVGNNCCCGGSGSSGSDGVLYFEITCLDSVCAGGTQFSCPSSMLPNNWCVTDFGTTNPSSGCPYLFDTSGIPMLGDLCFDVCSWGLQSFNDSDVTLVNCPDGYQLIMGIVCAGDNPFGVTGAAAPDNGMIVYAIVGVPGTGAEAVWFIAADDFDCHGSNVLVLIGSENSTNENWAASIEIHPCVRPARFDPGFCE